MSNDAVIRIKALLHEGVFSDLTITCGEAWKVHKSILWIQSEYFRKLLSGKFKVLEPSQHPPGVFPTCSCPVGSKAATRTLDLSADDPAVLAALIHYFYNFTLCNPVDAEGGHNTCYFVHVYAIADKYDVPHLRLLAEQRLRRTCNTHGQFASLAAQSDLINAIRAIDEHTPDRVEDGGGLWAIVLPALQVNITLLLSNEAFKELLLELPELNFRLLAMSDRVTPPRSVSGDSEEEDLEDMIRRKRPMRGDPRDSLYGQGRRLG